MPMRRVFCGRLVLTGIVALGLAGCGSTTPTKPAPPPFQGIRLTVAAVGDAAVLPTVTAQRGEWEASRGATCVIEPNAVEPANATGAHILVFGGDRLGDLVDAELLAVLPESLVQPPAKLSDDPDNPARETSESSASESEQADALQFSDVLPAFREQVSKYGSSRFALPYGGSALVLAYHSVAFEGEANREAAKKAGIKLEPPTTWEELDALAKFFQGRDWDGDGKSDFGIALALGRDAEGVGLATFLGRAASLGQHRDHYALLFDTDTMEPRIASPPFAEALSGLAALKPNGPQGVEAFDVAAARKAFRAGNVAMLIDRAESVASWAEKGRAVGVAVLPGSERVYEPVRKVWEKVPRPNRPSYLPHGGGWLVGVSASTSGREREAAIDFAKYLASPETSNRVRSDRTFPTLPFRGSQVGQGLSDPTAAAGVEPRLWSDAVAKTLTAARVVPGLRIPQADGYLADLERGRVDATAGTPAEKALQGVSAAWSSRNENLGVKRQLWHYQQSLNFLLTAPKPPPR